MNLKQKIKKFGVDYLSRFGFAQTKDWLFEKPLSGLTQAIGFVKGSSSKGGMFTAEVFMRYNTPYEKPGFDFWARIGAFSNGHDEWFKVTDEQSFDRLTYIFDSKVIDFLNDFSTISQIVKVYEDQRTIEVLGNFSTERLFGESPETIEFNLGFCYSQLKQYQKALTHLKASAQLLSIPPKTQRVPHDWMVRQRQVAIDMIRTIENDLYNSTSQ